MATDDRSVEPDARERLLTAGAELVGRLLPPDVLPGVRSVCRAAGLPTGSFYHCFDSSTDFQIELVRWLSEHDPGGQLSDQTRGDLADVAGAFPDAPDGTTHASRVAGVAGADIERIRAEGSSALRAQFLLFGVSSGDDAVAVAIREQYRRFYGRLAENEEAGIRSIVEGLGGSIRPPFTARSVALITCALVEGLLLRSQVDPDLDVATVMEDAIRVLIVALLAESADEADIDDLVAAAVERVARAGP